jgi:hypothetical protein
MDLSVAADVRPDRRGVPSRDSIDVQVRCTEWNGPCRSQSRPGRCCRLSRGDAAGDARPLALTSLPRHHLTLSGWSAIPFPGLRTGLYPSMLLCVSSHK